MPLILKPDPTDKTPNHFIVLYDGVQVGRIFNRVPGAVCSTRCDVVLDDRWQL